jgi:precorrin-6B methylase 2
MATSTPPAPPTSSMALIRLISGLWLSQLIYVIAKLGIPDLLRDGPRSADELAEETGAHAPSLYRVLRALSTVGVLFEDERGQFYLTPLSLHLRSGVHGSLRSLAIMFGEPWHWDVWGGLLHSVRTGEPAFEHVHGMGTYEYVTENAGAAAVYDSAMTSITRQAAAAIADAYDFEDVTTIVDIGGGHGTLLIDILTAHPHLRGTVFDLPHVVEGAHRSIAEAGLEDRLDAVGGDCFEFIEPGADAYITKSFIHSFDDERASRILATIRRALPPGGRVLVCEMVLPDDNEPHFGKLLDIEMLTQSADGRDRTEAQFRALFASAGLKLRRVYETSSPVSVLEAVIDGADR